MQLSTQIDSVSDLHTVRFFENKHLLSIHQTLGCHAVISKKNLLLFPNNTARGLLHGLHLGALDVQNDRINGFPLHLANSTCPIQTKVTPRHVMGKICVRRICQLI
jgi:hypothetical protein